MKFDWVSTTLMFDGTLFASIPGAFMEKKVQDAENQGALCVTVDAAPKGARSKKNVKMNLYVFYDTTHKEYVLEVEGFVFDSKKDEYGLWGQLFRGSFSEFATLITERNLCGGSELKATIDESIFTQDKVVCVSSDAMDYINNEFPEFAEQAELLDLHGIHYGGILASFNGREGEEDNSDEE